VLTYPAAKVPSSKYRDHVPGEPTFDTCTHKLTRKPVSARQFDKLAIGLLLGHVVLILQSYQSPPATRL
jgi:hypothetical protein